MKNGEGEGYQEINWLKIPVRSREWLCRVSMLAGEEEKNDGKKAGEERLGGVEGGEDGMEMQSVSQASEGREEMMTGEEVQSQMKVKGHVKWFNCTKGRCGWIHGIRHAWIW